MTDAKAVVLSEQEVLIDSRRRNLVKGAIALGVMWRLPIDSALAAAPAEVTQVPVSVSAFQKVSTFLTSKNVSPAMATRCYDALKKRIPDLDSVVASLDTLVKTRQLSHVDEYLALTDVDKGLDTQAKSIIRALYLGVVGDDEKAELFAYEEAFMYDPTRAILVVPTYGRGPNSWGPKPVDAVAEVKS
ncbi:MULTISPECIES: sugar dehydrogenase complex small subunit [unclassified Achromobacter]|uniref:sugar dehydrogenase complex small subunit n=1 Tax=unclassified Achromobacter TaxID=2626865 RepID=UPI000B51A774|nr:MULTISPECIES: sugar dehydrogenase complex small subunit [unclassified Achromobacter]OWT68104.1 sorbitol dehydrogenase [Achromobacter sp. HZ34]OWT69941.1 sorbitol dehydrogenase [Achromobacter sp. HZ28]